MKRLPIRLPTGLHDVCSCHVIAPALVAITALWALCPAAVRAQNAAVTKKDSASKTYVAMDYGYVNFHGDIEPWRLASLSLGRSTSRGSLIGRVNYAKRFATSGLQFEADAYPRLGSGTYAYLNAGYSHADIFPTWRFGGELFASLPSAWEASVGFRQLRFTGSPVTLYTGSVGKYVGNYWLSLRPFLRIKESGTSTSAGLTARRYFADGEHYFGARVGYGSTPSDRITPDELVRTKSFSADLHGSGGLWQDVLGTWSLGYDREELAHAQIRKSWTGTAGLKFFF
jgi:YaiO family outer membrane protein